MAISNISPITMTIRKAGAEDVDRVCETLSAAFYAGRILSWCYPDPDPTDAAGSARSSSGRSPQRPCRRGSTPWPMHVPVRVPPEAELDEEQLAGDLMHVSGDDAARVVTLFALIDHEHPTGVPHQYLFALGTRPEWQSLRAVLDPGDEDGTPAYLEASSERNKQLYVRYGFEVRTTVRLPDGPPLWCMWREPQR